MFAVLYAVIQNKVILSKILKNWAVEPTNYHLAHICYNIKY